MKLFVGKRRYVFCIVIAVMGTIVLPKYVPAENTLLCERPPGGSMTCETGQTPICEVYKTTKEVHGSCVTPPKGFTGKRLASWLLSKIVGKPITLEEASSPYYIGVIKDGRWEDDNSIKTFNFKKELFYRNE